MSQTQYDIFIETIKKLYHGFSFQYERELIQTKPTIISPYDFFKVHKNTS